MSLTLKIDLTWQKILLSDTFKEIFNHFLFLSYFFGQNHLNKKIQESYINYYIMKLFVLVALLCVLSYQYTLPNLMHLVQPLIKQNFGQPKTVPYVNITKYAGKWYEQAVIPYYFERYCTKTTATYSLNPDGKSVRVDNSCVRHGKLVESVGKAIPEDSTNAKLKVEFVQTLDIGAQYWVVRLDEAYTYAVISSPNYNYLWVLYRQPHMPESLYTSIYNDLKKDGFPVQKLTRTEQ